MADFKTALEALAKGELKLESLSKQLKILLEKSPQFANKMLAQLDKFHAQKQLGDKQYAHLKRQINEFRRAHPSETETSAESGNSDSTVFSQDSVIENSPATGDATVVMSEEEKSDTTGGDSSDFFDISMPGANTATPSITSATGPAGTEWNDPNIPEGDLSGGYDVGSVIKQRFKLEKVLGIGGMGKVYKALDLLKAEAKDKKPYVAIKLLNDDFKDHPEAFISLQRESSRQQKLAHPNIATIYDFDRVGGPNTPVYITMELMEGMELKDYIKKTVRPKGGLNFDDANGIIKQLGAGLIYAHDRRLVHSDFKPGNAFMCNDGIVKTLDFGIARAVKNPVTGEAEKTLFDPGKLGALTPAYASLEMLEGEEPDTRDDTYALGCTAYELLTTKHPFNKLPANKAKENDLVPPYIKKLNKKQNRALRHAVAFKREDRSPTVAHFLEEFEGKATWYKNPFVIAAGVLLIIGMMLIAPALDYVHQLELDGMVAEISSEQITEAEIVTKLEEILLLDKTDQTTVTSDDEAKKAIQNFFSDKVASLIDTSDDSFNFPVAEETLTEITQFYPDSIYLQDQTKLVSESKKTIISDLYAEYITALDDPSLIDSTRSILAKISKVDASHPLLKDSRPSNAYRVFALAKFEEKEFNVALSLIESGLASAADDPRLLDLKKKIEDAQTVARLESELNVVKDQLSSLSDYKAQESTIIDLARLKPESELITSLSESFKPIVEAELKTITSSGTRENANEFASAFESLMNGLRLNKQLTKVKLAHLKGDERKQAITDLANADISNVETALSAAQIGDTQWETTLLENIQELESLLDEDKSIATSLEQFRGQISKLYIAKANETLQEERFDAADGYVDIGERFAPGAQELLDMRDAVTSAREESDRIARVESNKGSLKIFADSGTKVAEALDLFEKLKADLPDTDDYIVTEAPRMLGEMFARLARNSAETKAYERAFSFVTKGLELDPFSDDLTALKREYQSEANIIELTKLFKTATTFPDDVGQKITQIENGNAARYDEFSKASTEEFLKRITTLRATDENAAAGLAQSAARLFPANAKLADLKKELQLKPWAGLAAASAAIKSNKLTQATQIQQAAADEFSTYPDYGKFTTILESKIKAANESFDEYMNEKETAGENYDDLRLAKRMFQRVKKKWPDNPDYAAEETLIDALIKKHKPISKPKIRTVEKELTAESIAKADASTGTGTTAAKVTPWTPIESDSECTDRLAGYGKRAKAICFDMIHSSARGPLMVVVPSGEGFEKSFAIGKYEVSVSDWGKYCILSGTCQPIKDKSRKNDPMTGITLKQAQDYAAWLSERTGKTYRIPTKLEWEYVANSAGKQPKKDFNCRVTVSEKLIKGTGIVSVKSGKSNGWGLKNYVGNVQEWVIDGSATTARGGAFTDAHSKCEISLERSHNGSADEATGFRLMRENVG